MDISFTTESTLMVTKTAPIKMGIVVHGSAKGQSPGHWGCTGLCIC